jgi:hypothetical protein
MMVSMVNLNDAFVMRPVLQNAAWGRDNSPWYNINEWQFAS